MINANWQHSTIAYTVGFDFLDKKFPVDVKPGKTSWIDF